LCAAGVKRRMALTQLGLIEEKKLDEYEFLVQPRSCIVGLGPTLSTRLTKPVDLKRWREFGSGNGVDADRVEKNGH
jgi:hypothetical protein